MYRMYGSRTPKVGALGDAGAIVEDKFDLSQILSSFKENSYSI